MRSESSNSSDNSHPSSHPLIAMNKYYLSLTFLITFPIKLSFHFLTNIHSSFAAISLRPRESLSRISCRHAVSNTSVRCNTACLPLSRAQADDEPSPEAAGSLTIPRLSFGISPEMGMIG